MIFIDKNIVDVDCLRNIDKPGYGAYNGHTIEKGCWV